MMRNLLMTFVISTGVTLFTHAQPFAANGPNAFNGRSVESVARSPVKYRVRFFRGKRKKAPTSNLLFKPEDDVTIAMNRPRKASAPGIYNPRRNKKPSVGIVSRHPNQKRMKINRYRKSRTRM